MTRYAVDVDAGTLLRTWATDRGDRAAVLAALPESADPDRCLVLAAELTGLSEELWRCYTHPASAARSLRLNTEGWRRAQTRDAFGELVQAVMNPELPGEDGSLIVSYDPVQESANRVGRALHELGDGKLSVAVRADVEAEVQAVDMAERADLQGRAQQAVVLSRADANPAHVSAADELLRQDLLAADGLFKLDPTAASIAAAHWLKAAVDVAAEASGMPAERVLLEICDEDGSSHEAAAEVLSLLEFDATAYGIVVAMVSRAMRVAEGYASDIGGVLVDDELTPDEEEEEGEGERFVRGDATSVLSR